MPWQLMQDSEARAIDSRYSAIFNASKGSTVAPPIQRYQCAKAHDQMAFGSNSPCQTYSVVVMSSLHEQLPFADWFGFVVLMKIPKMVIFSCCCLLRPTNHIMMTTLRAIPCRQGIPLRARVDIQITTANVDSWSPPSPRCHKDKHLLIRFSNDSAVVALRGLIFYVRHCWTS